MSHSLAGEPPSAGRRAAPSTTAGYSAAEWELLTRLPGRIVVVTAASGPGRVPRGVAAGLAGLEAVAAGRSFDSDLVRAVVAAIYARDDPRACDPAADPVDLLADCRAAVRVLQRRADPADSAAYRQWTQSVAARVCQRSGAAVSPADRRYLDRLGAALGLR